MADEKQGLVSAFWKSAVGSVGAAVAVWLLGWFGPIWSFVCQYTRLGWMYLMAKSQWPNWSAYLVSLPLAMFIFLSALRYWRNRKNNHSRFTQLNFGGSVLWRWQSISSLPYSLVPYCPKCDMQLVYDYDDGERYTGTQRHTVLICERCDTSRQLCRELGNYSDLQARVTREIVRLIRTGEWRQHVPDALPKGAP